MSTLKKAIIKFRCRFRHAKECLHNTSEASSKSAVISTSSSSEVPLGDGGEPLSKNQQRKQAKKERQIAKAKANEQRKESVEKRREAEDERAAKEEPRQLRARYGSLRVAANQYKVVSNNRRVDISTLSSRRIGEEVTFRARLHTLRNLSSSLAFLVFRQQLSTIQGVLREQDGIVSNHMVRWAEHIPTESVVLVTGILQKPKEEVKGASVHDVEILVQELHVMSHLTESLPFSVYEDDVPKEETHEADGINEEMEGEKHRRHHITDRTRLSNRIVDLRTATSQAIFRVNSGICNIFRYYLDSQGFIEVHTPKLQGGATESGASVFELDYFGRPAFLAQSPQLAKQMCISADFERVYEIGPVFRAENSNTHRHLTEYTGLDLEMAIDEHYHEALQLIDDMLKHIWKGIYRRFGRELEVIKRQFPHEDLIWLDETPRIPFSEGVRLLRDSGWTGDDGNPPSEYEDLSTRAEIRLGQLVKEKFHTDYYILDKFPVSARPFYTMPDPDNNKITNSFDIFLRGQEIISGGQRIHDAKMLENQMAEQGVKREGMEDYLEGFRWGAPPHAGCGIGLERLVMLFLNLGNIRLASLFPRDPRSLPAKHPKAELRHPEASTLHPPWEGDAVPDMEKEKQFQPLGKLIANYGDASNTSWLDDRYQVWRYHETGAAVSYVPTDSFAIIVGDPLCDKIQYTTVITTFLQHLKKQTNLKPLWLLASRLTEEILGTKLGWSTLTCLAENRLDPRKNLAQQDHDIARKVRHADREGVKISESPTPVPSDLRAQTDARVKDWLAKRTGTQVHLTQIHPWRDAEHRRYFFAHDKAGTLATLVVLAQLAPDHGYQVKYSLDFPGAPSGTIEATILQALQTVAREGVKNVTFGGGASSSLKPEHHLNGVRIRALEHSYKAIATRLKLTQKSEFREKLGAEEDPVFVCFPRHGLGSSGVKAIMKFLQEDDE